MVSYKPLWRLLVEREMQPAELRKLVNITPNTMTRMRKNEDVSIAVLSKICACLDVSYGDIIEYIPDKKQKEESING